MENGTADVETRTGDFRYSASWGLSSVLLGGFLGLLAMLMLLMNLQLFLSAPVWGLGDIRALHTMAVAGAILLPAMGAASITFGVISLVSAYRRRQVSALGWAGLMLSLLATALWIGALADLFSVLEHMAQRQGMHIVVS